MTAGEILTAISIAPDGSTAAVHLLSVQTRVGLIGTNLSSNIGSMVSDLSGAVAIASISSIMESDNTTAIMTSSTSTLSAEISCP